MFDHDFSDYQKQDFGNVLNGTKSGSEEIENQKVVESKSEIQTWDCSDGACMLSWKPARRGS